jgi:protocatechuate 3,4-dioxygenase, beta subunit
MSGMKCIGSVDGFYNRRTFLGGLAAGVSALVNVGVFAEELVRTPRQTAGPFYPDKLPIDTDNDLLIINDGLTPAVGEVTWLSGRILDSAVHRCAMRP